MPCEGAETLRRRPRFVGAERTRIAALLLNLVLLTLSVPAAARVPSSDDLRSQDPGFRERFDRGISMYLNGEFDEAEILFRQLDFGTGLSPHDREILALMVGKCLYGQGAYLDCKRHFELFLSRHPETAHESAVRLYLGHCYYHLRDYSRASLAYAAAMVSGSKEHRRIAEANLEPLVKNALRLHELEYLLIGLGDEDSHNRVRLWIADRWYDAGWRRQAEEVYRRIVSDSRKSPAGREAADRIEEIEYLKAHVLFVSLMSPLSGDFARYGQQVQQAAMLAEEKAGDRVKILICDTQGDPTRASRLADSLARLGSQVVIGPLVPAAIRSAADIFQQQGIVQLLPLARREDFTTESPYLFQMASPPRIQGRMLAEYATRVERMTRLGVLASDTPEGHEAAASFADVAAGKAVVYPPEFYTPGDTDFGEQLRRLKRQTADPASKVDADGKTAPFSDWVPILDGMVIWGDPQDFVLIVPQVVFHRFRVQYFGPAAWGETSALGRIRTALDSVVFVSDEWVDTTRTGWQEFARRYRSRWKETPTSLAGRVYDLVTWLIQGVEAGYNFSRLAEFVTRPEGHRGVTGTWRFSEERLPASTPIYRYRRGIPVRLESD